MYIYSNTVFGQLLNFLPKVQFNAFVGQHQSDRYVKKLSTWGQLTIMLFAQASGKERLRDIEIGLKSHSETWYHLGIGSCAKSTLAYANENRDYHTYESLFYALLKKCQAVAVDRHFDFKNPLYSLDSTTIQLCLNLFDWAHFRTLKGALKIHMLLNNRTAMPELLNITNGKVADITAAKTMDLTSKLERGSIVVFDRGYIDYAWWQKLNENGLFFVSRVKKNQKQFVLGQHQTRLETNILKDEIVMIDDYSGSKKYPKELRRVTCFNQEKQCVYVYLTNNFELKASQIALIYKQRWQIELFFKWIKQNLKIKSFLGTSRNAVLTQIWIAMIYYLLLAYIKFQTKLKKSLLDFTRLIRDSLLFRRDLIDLLSLNYQNISKLRENMPIQLGFL
jgi:hypothetical protein